MIRAEVRRREGRIGSLQVLGHAGTAPYGQDLVCAAVSAVVQTALLGLAALDPSAPAARVREGDVRWQGRTGDIGQAILETCLIGLQDIAKSHPQALAVEVGEESA